MCWGWSYQGRQARDKEEEDKRRGELGMFQTLEDLLRSLSLRGDAEFLQHVERDLVQFLVSAPAPDATVQFPRLSEHRQQLIMSTARRFGMKAKTEACPHCSGGAYCGQIVAC